MVEQSPRTRKRSLTKSQANLLRRHLRGRDAPCPFCDFNLRDYEEEHCPECHEPLSYTKMKRGLPKLKRGLPKLKRGRSESKYKFTDDPLDKFCAGLVGWHFMGKIISILAALFMPIAVIEAFWSNSGSGQPLIWCSIVLSFGITLVVGCSWLARLFAREPRLFTELPRSVKWFIAIPAAIPGVVSEFALFVDFVDFVWFVWLVLFVLFALFVMLW